MRQDLGELPVHGIWRWDTPQPRGSVEDDRLVLDHAKPERFDQDAPQQIRAGTLHAEHDEDGEMARAREIVGEPLGGDDSGHDPGVRPRPQDAP